MIVGAACSSGDPAVSSEGGGAGQAGGGAGLGGGGGAGLGGGGGGPTTPVAEVECEGSTLLQLPDDPRARGPWAVGAKTLTIDGLRTEIWYPAEPGSEAGKDKIQYDLREHLPEADQMKIPDADNPLQACDCYRDLPIDAAHGPYPLVVFLHGTAAFRTQSATQMTHWASRGFIVIAADHPNLELKDALAFRLNADQPGDANRLLHALESPSGDLAFLDGRIAPDRKAFAGHSAGGSALASFGAERGVRVLIPMAAGGAQAGESLRATLVLGAVDDSVVAYSRQQQGYGSTPATKRLVGLANAGHLAFSDLCAIGSEQGGILQVALDHGVQVNPLIAALAQDGCRDGQLPPEVGWEIINYATAAALEEQLSCSTSAAAKLSAIEGVFPEVEEYQESL